MRNDRWFKQNPKVVTPFVDESVKMNQHGLKVCSYGLSPSGYDLRLKEIKVRDLDVRNDFIDPKAQWNPPMKALPVATSMDGERFCLIPPRSVAYGSTYETIAMPRDTAGHLLIKSTYGRLGLSIINPLIDPEFVGELTVSFVNNNPVPVYVFLDEGFAQLVCFNTGGCDVSYHEKGGRYQYSTGVTDAR